MDKQTINDLKEAITIFRRDLHNTMLITRYLTFLLEEIAEHCCNHLKKQGNFGLALATLRLLTPFLEQKIERYSQLEERLSAGLLQETLQKSSSLDLPVTEQLVIDDLKHLIDLLKKKGVLPDDFLNNP